MIESYLQPLFFEINIRLRPAGLFYPESVLVICFFDVLNAVDRLFCHLGSWVQRKQCSDVIRGSLRSSTSDDEFDLWPCIIIFDLETI